MLANLTKYVTIKSGDFMKMTIYESAIEAILFTSPELITIEAIAEAVNLTVLEANQIIVALAQKYESELRGIEIAPIGGGWQMRTAPRAAEFVKQMFAPRRIIGLSQALLETLAIVTFEQPCSKAEIEAIRGVEAKHGVDKLIDYGLIHEVGRSNAPGKPLLFGTTPEFWRHFGLSGADELRDFFADAMEGMD